MTTNGRPVIPSNSNQPPPNGAPPPAWFAPQYQPTWQQPPQNRPEPRRRDLEPSNSLTVLWIITALSGVAGVVLSSGHEAARVALGAGLLGYCGVSLLVALAVQAIRAR